MNQQASASASMVLVIDDEHLNRKLIRSFLKLEGIEVLEAGDAESGLAVARSEDPDLILLDLRLPGMGGLEAMRILKADESTRTIPVLILSAGSLASDETQFLAAGAAGLILKPFSRQELVAAVRRVMG